MKDNVVVNNICEYIKNKILTKEMFPGFRIVEEDIAKELGISRTPLRRALSQLQYEGFINIIPNRGTFVVTSSNEDIEKIYVARKCIEDGLAAEIIKNVQDKDIDDLMIIHEKLCDTVKTGSVIEYAQENMRFHVRLAEISKNDYLIKYSIEIQNRTSIFLVYYDRSMQDLDSITKHIAILDALKEKNVDALITALRNDMNQAHYGKKSVK